jgi:cytoskeletal protein CcmA (bactofilin family)
MNSYCWSSNWPKFSITEIAPRFDFGSAGCYRPKLPKVEGNFFPMAWFDRAPGEKKGAENESEHSAPVVKVNPEPAKVAAPVTPPPIPKPAAAPVTASAQTVLVGHLYKGSRVSGQLMFQGPARIDGNVEGEIQCYGTLTIGEGAEVRAKISSQVVVICGKVEGNVTAKEKVELLSPARVVGNISTPRLTITDGVVVDGDCSMGMAKQKSGVASSLAVSADKAVLASTPALQSDSLK